MLFFAAISIFLISCQKNDEIVTHDQNQTVERRALTDAEKLLKDQMSQAAKTIAEIGRDQDVLDDIVQTIKKQPREMEDKVKFAHLMQRSSQLKSLDVLQGSGAFAQAFAKHFQGSDNLKSSSTLIDDIIANGIEIHIPYPIEDYPEGTDIVITSHPIDNDYENIGYFLGRPNESIMANEELTKDYPVIIVNLNQTTEKQIEKSLKAEEQKQVEKSATTYIDPMSVWEDGDNYRFQIYIGEVYIKEDGISGLFNPDGRVYMTNTGVAFNSQNSFVSIPASAEVELFGERFPRKYEGYAKEGYGKGWLYLHTVFMEDWHPGIIEKPFVAFMDHPNREVSSSITLAAKIVGEVTGEFLGVTGVTLKPEGSYSHAISTKITYSDLLYRSKIYYRSTYKFDYNRTGDIWSPQIYGNHHRYYEEYPELGNRPPIKLTNEFFYTTYCRVIPK